MNASTGGIEDDKWLIFFPKFGPRGHYGALGNPLDTYSIQSLSPTCPLFHKSLITGTVQTFQMGQHSFINLSERHILVGGHCILSNSLLRTPYSIPTYICRCCRWVQSRNRSFILRHEEYIILHVKRLYT